MMISLVTVNKKFKNLIWFHNTFYSYSSIFFYRYTRSQISVLLDRMADLVINNIGYKLFSATCDINNIKYFNFLKGSFFVVYSNNFYSIATLKIDGFLLFALSYNGYFINPSYLNNILDIYLLYNKNYVFIISYCLWFVSIINLLIVQVKSLMILIINIIKILYLNLFKTLPLFLSRVENKYII